MPEEVKTRRKLKNKNPKGPLGKLKEKVEDSEDRLALLSTFVRLGILVWSGGILTLAYIKLPPAFGIPEQKLDPTFIASVFTEFGLPLVSRLPRVLLLVEELRGQMLKN